VKGLLEVKVHTEVREQSVGQLIPGEYFGEMSLLTGDSRAATVIAVTESSVYELSHEILSPLLKSRPDMSNILCLAVAGRKKKTVKTIAKVETYPDVEEAGFVSEMRRRINDFFGLDQ
jgi:CRP-like cAMP-binding protein